MRAPFPKEFAHVLEAHGQKRDELMINDHGVDERSVGGEVHAAAIMDYPMRKRLWSYVRAEAGVEMARRASQRSPFPYVSRTCHLKW